MRSSSISGSEWGRYYAAVAEEPPRGTLLHALQRFAREPAAEQRFAVDLGCGGGRDTLELLRQGWRVLAIDREVVGIDRLLSYSGAWDRSCLQVRVGSFEEAAWPAADLVNASLALPFCSPALFPAVWGRVVASLRPGGRFAGQLFGERDAWATLPGRTHHTRSAAQVLLRGLEVELFQEQEYDGHTRLGEPKHWHVFDVVARRA